MPINTGAPGRKVKSEEYFDDSFVYFLNCLWFRLPDDASHQDRHQGCANPEIIDIGKVVSLYAIYQMLVALDEQTAHDVLDAGTQLATPTTPRAAPDAFLGAISTAIKPPKVFVSSSLSYISFHSECYMIACHIVLGQ